MAKYKGWKEAEKRNIVSSRSMKKISTKISMVIVICSCIAVLSLAIITLKEGADIVRNEAEEKLLWMARTYTLQFNEEFRLVEEKVGSIEMYVDETFDLKAAKADPAYMGRYEKQLADYLFEYAKDHTNGFAAWCYFNPELSDTPHDVYFVDGDGDKIPDRQKYIDFSYYDGTPTKTDDKYWWYGPVETGKLVWTNPYEWKLINGEIIKVASCAMPVYQDGELVAVVGTYYRFDQMKEKLDKIKVYENGYVALFNEKLDVISHPEYFAGTRNTSDNFQTVDDGKFAEVSKEMLKNDSGIAHFKINGRTQISAYSKMTNGWIMGIRPPMNELYAGLRSLLMQLIGTVLACMLLSLILAYYVGKRVAAPTLRVSEAAKLIGKGDFSVQVNVETKDETKVLADSINNMVNNINGLNNDLVKLAYYDALTGIPNKNYFERAARDTLNSQAGQFSYVVTDINKFKLINHIFGFEQGDQLLKHVAEILHGMIKENELCARISGDCFNLMLEYNGKDEMEKRLRRAAERICNYRFEFNSDYKLSVGIGVYVIEDKQAAISTMGDHAKLALSKIKGIHNSPVYFYNENIQNKIMEEQEIENAMENALKNGEFEMYLQPKYRIDTEKIVGAEALVRWNNPSKGLISPNNFIPVFEKNGFIADLDMYMLECVCKMIKDRMDEGLRMVPISVNQSRQYLNQSDYIAKLTGMLCKYDVPSRLVELEITETAFFENQEEMISIIKDLHDLGFSISMDDFGSGYSSLNMLQDILVDVLKLDRLFFKESINSERGKKIVENIIAMASELKITIVAEGIENQEQLDFLKGGECNIVQGYFFSRPICRRAFETLFDEE